MAVDAKQIEWIWEFFLKNCKDARMIQELVNTLPFPNENLDLERMLLLWSVSLQISEGIIDELTLDILRVLGELRGASEAIRKDRRPADFSCQEVAKRRKVAESESNADDLATNSSTPQVREGRPPWTTEQRRESSKDGRKAKTVVGIWDWLKGRALPRSVGEDQTLETFAKGSNLNRTCSGNAGTPHGAADRDRSRSELVFMPGQSAPQWELELAVMLELAVKHLRGDSPDRKSFEHAVTKHWGDSPDGTETWPAADSQEMIRVRDQIKSELWIVWRNPELLDALVEKYTKSKVEDMLNAHLEKAWAATGQTFLEGVSADVENGKYKPVNCSDQRPKKGGSPLEDGDAGKQSNGVVDTSEKPWIRASRGRYSRTREKVQKNFAIWELDDADVRDKDCAKTRAEQQASGGPNPLDRGHVDDYELNQKNKTFEGDEVRLSLPTEGGLEINARSLRFDGSIARVLEFEEPDGPESIDRRQSGQEKQDPVRANIEITEADHPLDQTNVPETASVGDDADVTLPEIAKAPGTSNVINPSEGNERETSPDENRTKAGNSPKRPDEPHEVVKKENVRETSTDENRRKAGSSPKRPDEPREVVKKENVVPSSAPRPTDLNPTVCFSPPPWVEGPRTVHVAERITPGVARKRKSGSIQGETGAGTRREEESRSAEALDPTTCSNQCPDTVSTPQNLRRKQRLLDAVVQDPLPKILTSRPKGSLLERIATAHTVEWDDDDDMEESPSNSPTESRHVRLPHPTPERRVSPLAGSKTTGNTNAKHTRRKSRRWSEKEVESLKTEVSKYGKGRWKLILEKNLGTFEGRTEVDLKDKWRNLERFEGITD